MICFLGGVRAATALVRDFGLCEIGFQCVGAECADSGLVAVWLLTKGE